MDSYARTYGGISYDIVDILLKDTFEKQTLFVRAYISRAPHISKKISRRAQLKKEINPVHIRVRAY